MNMAKPSRKTKAANVSVSLYDGSLDMCFDCVGTDKCEHVRFYIEPPAPDDECAFSRYGGSCTCWPARKVALEQLRDRITDELTKEYEG